jgi:predicted ATPase
MAIEFRLSKLSIENFRGIAAMQLDFPRDVPLTLIGGNNAGKSTVLNAIAFALEGPSFHNYSADEFDFFRTASGELASEFCIEVCFEADRETCLPAVRGIENPVPIYGARAKGKCFSNGRIQHSTELFTTDSATAYYTPRLPIKSKQLAETYKEHDIGFKKVKARLFDIQEQRPEVWLLRPDNLHPALYTWRTGPLQLLSSWLAKAFVTEKWDFDYAGKKNKMPSSIENAHRFFREAVSAFPVWRDDLRVKLSAALSQYLGRQASLDLKPQIQAVEDWLAQQLALSFSADSGGACTPLDRMGHGWQTLVRMAALDVLSQIPGQTREKIVLLVEEPETYLHPHLTRKVRAVLSALAQKGWTIVITTHSPSFISFRSKQVVTRMRREGDNVGFRSIDTTSFGPHLEFQEKLDSKGSHEMLFAQRAILCEGQDDVFAVRTFLEKCDMDLDAMGVSVVDAGGVGSLPDLTNLAKSIGIPWCAITDEDLDQQGKIKEKTQKARQTISNYKSTSDSMPIWKGSLEQCFQLVAHKAKPDWQAANVASKTIAQLRVQFPNYCACCDQVIEFLKH